HYEPAISFQHAGVLDRARDEQRARYIGFQGSGIDYGIRARIDDERIGPCGIDQAILLIVQDQVAAADGACPGNGYAVIERDRLRGRTKPRRERTWPRNEIIVVIGEGNAARTLQSYA